MKVSDLKQVYFIGIGGIGMSALARYLNSQGVKVSGYDLVKTSLTETLSLEGMTIHYEESIDMIPQGLDLVVYTPAIPDTHEELQWLQSQDIRIMKRAELLGLLSRDVKTVAVAGTHGKTTTSALITHVLKNSGVDVTAFLGGILSDENTNYIEGTGTLLVLEADEFDRSFLHLNPDVLAIVSMDPDHLDVYGEVDEMRAAYVQLTSQIKDGGLLILGPDVYRHISVQVENELRERGVRTLRMLKHFDFKNVIIQDHRYCFDYQEGDDVSGNLRSQLPGTHNLINTTLAIRICKALGLGMADIKKSLDSFKGVKRRFEFVYEKNGVVLIDDYAHHPEELKYTVATVRDLFFGKKILGIFQPHLYSRTLDFYKEFADVLGGLDAVLLLPIYPAREEAIEGVTSELIYNLVRSDDKFLVTEQTLIDKINALSEYSIIVTIGASDLDKHHSKIKTVIDNRK